jgi:hypothetical protein
VQGLAERIDREAALAKLRVIDDRLMLAAIVLHVLVDFVGEDGDGPIPGQCRERVQIGGAGDGAGGVVRIVDDDEPRPRAHGGPHAIPVVSEIRRRQWNVDAAPARQADRRVVGVVGRIEDDRLVTGPHDGLDG